MRKFAHTLYPSLVGIMLGIMQTGLYFQLAFTLSSGFGTYLMMTLSWLAGSTLGVLVVARLPIRTGVFLVAALVAYGTCSAMMLWMPFNTSLWLGYALLIIVTGVYPGVFFARAASGYRASVLFFLENNGFIVGLALGTLLFMLLGRVALWLSPCLLAASLLLIPSPSDAVAYNVTRVLNDH